MTERTRHSGPMWQLPSLAFGLSLFVGLVTYERYGIGPVRHFIACSAAMFGVRFAAWTLVALAWSRVPPGGALPPVGYTVVAAAYRFRPVWFWSADTVAFGVFAVGLFCLFAATRYDLALLVGHFLSLLVFVSLGDGAAEWAARRLIRRSRADQRQEKAG